MSTPKPRKQPRRKPTLKDKEIARLDRIVKKAMQDNGFDPHKEK